MDIITDFLAEIVKIALPLKAFLVSKKISTKGELVSFKLALIVEDVPSTAELEGELYMKCDCSVPCDILIYNRTEWEELTTDYGTFAWHINTSGEVLYER